MKDKSIYRHSYGIFKITDFVDTMLIDELEEGCLEKINKSVILLICAFGRLCNVLANKGLITPSELVYIITRDDDENCSFED